jgi:hypothetical protein
MTPAQRGETSWQLRHDAHALIGAHSHPVFDFRKAAPATDAKRRDRIDCAYFVAGALDVAHGVVGADVVGKIKIAARKANTIANRTSASPPIGPQPRPQSASA